MGIWTKTIAEGALDASQSISDKQIWIDLDNSPHVPFFHPIIVELKLRGYPLLITGRDAYQVKELADQFGIQLILVGGHYGKNKFLKAIGLAIRVLQLMWLVLYHRPSLAVAHGSRAMSITCILLGIPSMAMFDYEHTAGLPKFMKQKYALVPALLPDDLAKFRRYKHVSRYDGLKEDVYVAAFEPDNAIYEELGLAADNFIVTIRPPATEAHYHNSESEKLFAALIHFFAERQFVTMVILPRNSRQEEAIRQNWADLIATGAIIIPQKAVNGLNLIWHSDLVISGGGTINREAAALGVPVYSIFRGTIGAVDRHLANTGRLVLLEKPDDVYQKIVLRKRDISAKFIPQNQGVLNQVVNEIIAKLEV